MAQSTTTTMRTTMLMWPREATTPPRMTAVSPGKMKPMRIAASAKTKAPTKA